MLGVIALFSGNLTNHRRNPTSQAPNSGKKSNGVQSSQVFLEKSPSAHPFFLPGSTGEDS
jgi:hypothetical protein